MHDIWNPWHGCFKKSEGCQNCYMYYLDKQRGALGSKVYKVRNNFDYPLHKNKDGSYKIKSGETLRVCMTSDFFLEEADEWRSDAWDIIRKRSDVIFRFITKRPERIEACLPSDWGDGWENCFLHITAENQIRADERIPMLLSLPFKHKGVICAPFIGEVSLLPYLKTGQIEEVIVGGENYDGARVCNYDWVKKLYDECVGENIRFCFMETGNVFLKDGKRYHLKNKRIQSVMAYRSGLQFEGKDIDFKLNLPKGDLFGNNNLYQKKFGKNCEECGGRLICNGCSGCNKCGNM